MGMDINTLLIKSTNINKQDYLSLIEKYDINCEDLPSFEGYEILHIDDEDIDCFKIGEEISKKLNTTTISLFSYDSDFAIFQLADVNTIIRIVFNKELASSYDYDINDQNIEILVNYIDNNHTIDDIKEIIDNEYTFAEDGLDKILELFNIDFNEIEL